MPIGLPMLRCFSAVAQTGNLAEAAIQLGRTQSAVSMMLKQLEDHLGQKLFEGERKNRLTPLGQDIFQMAQNQLRQFDDTVAAIETAAKAPKGHLRIASVPSVAEIALPHILVAMTEKHTGLKIELRDTDSDKVIDAVLRGQADIGIVSGKPSLNGVQQEVLFEDRFGLVCSPTHPFATQSKAPSIAEVLSKGFVGNTLCHRIKDNSIARKLTNAQVTIHNTLSLISMVRTGHWTTILPKTVTRILPDAIAFRELDDLEEYRTVSALVRERSLFPEFVDEMVSLLRAFDWDE